MDTLGKLNDLLTGQLEKEYSLALRKVLENIFDRETRADKPRKITITLSFSPDEERSYAVVSADFKTSLIPRKAAAALITLEEDDAGFAFAEKENGITPGQIDLSGKEHGEIIRINI